MAATKAIADTRLRIWPEAKLAQEERKAVDQLLSDYRRAVFDLRGLRGRLLRPAAIALVKSGWRKSPVGFEPTTAANDE